MSRLKRNNAELEAITNFREKAKKENISLKELGAKLKLNSPQYIYELLNTTNRWRRLHLEDFVNLCIVLDISPNEALSFEG